MIWDIIEGYIYWELVGGDFFFNFLYIIVLLNAI